MGIGFSSTEEFVWKRLAACHGAEEREMHAHYCSPFYYLLFCCGVIFFFFLLLCGILPRSFSLGSGSLDCTRPCLVPVVRHSERSVCSSRCPKDEQAHGSAATSEPAVPCLLWGLPGACAGSGRQVPGLDPLQAPRFGSPAGSGAWMPCRLRGLDPLPEQTLSVLILLACFAHAV